MAIKINTAYKEILTSSMLNEKISGVVGGNEKVNGFDVSISTPTSVAIKPGKAYINGCCIEETSETKTISLNSEMTFTDGIVYVVLTYTHETKNVEFTCVKTVNANMVKLATLVIKNGAVTELVNHESINTLNTIVGASADIEAQKIRDAIPSGFTELGQLDYDFMLNNENKVKIKGKSIAYVNGYRIEIPADTIINIGKAPEKESREDLLFLEAWKDSDFAKNGKLKWRIRHVADVDFNKYAFEGFAKSDSTVNWVDGNPKIQVQGALASPVNYWYGSIGATSWSTKAMRKHSGNSGVKLCLDDSCIFISGLGDNESKQQLKTLDGYVYAIPMFRIYRKPSCGKSTPFEYSKINPTVDYSKFVKLVKEEKVERVIGENIQGRSLVNLLNPKMLVELGRGVGLKYTFDSVNCILTNPGNNDMSPWSNAANVMNIIPSGGVFTLILENIKDTSVKTEVTLYNVSGNPKGVSNASIAPHSVRKLKIQTDADTVGMSFKLYSGTAPSSCRVMALEGDWTNKEIPGFFIGLKSLGEDDGNLITVKNGILNSDSYDVNDGSQKLTTVPNLTYINSGNLIIPKIEAVIKKGSEQTSLRELGAKITTDGTEIVEFAKIKGYTMQNCYPTITRDAFLTLNGVVENGYVVLEGTGDNFKNAFISINKCVIKPNTQYTMVVDVAENTLIKDLVLASNIPEDVFKTPADAPAIKIPSGATGVHKYLVTSTQQFANNTLGLRSYISYSETGKVRFRIMLLEGNRTNTSTTELPFIEGIKSVGENDNIVGGKYPVKVDSCGKNVINLADMTKRIKGGNTHIGGWVDAYYYKNIDISKLKGIHSVSATHTVNGKPVKCKFLLSRNKVVDAHESHTGLYLDIAGKGNGYGVEMTSGDNCDFTDYNFLHVTPSNAENHGLTELDISISNIQIEEGATATSHEEYKGHTQTIYLNEPLRSVPNGVCDEIIGNKVIRKVGIDAFVGKATEGWKEDTTRHLTNTLFFEIPRKYNTNRSIFCDRLPTKATGAAASIWSTDEEVCSFDDYWNVLVVRVNKNRLATPNLQGFKAWLAQNPMTVIYGLASQTEEYLENIYEKESIKTYQLDAPLRSLPNGTRDEIKDGVLIRRCGEVILDGSSDEVYHSNHAMNNHTAYWVSSTPKNFKHFSALLCDKLNQTKNIHVDNVGVFTANYPYVYVVVPKTLTPREYLKANPIRVVYELAVPVEIPLAEAAPQTANFSFYGRFAEGNWLRELPNGVRDTVENGKVIRRVGKMTLRGTEQWDLLQSATGWTNNDVLAMDLKNISTLKAGAQFIHNNKNLETACGVHGPFGMTHYIATWASGSNIVLGIKRSLLATQDLPGLKAWLSKNPITILYELATSKEEELTNDNYTYYPNHEVNTYCGSMYVGDGRNNILNESKIPSEHPVVIETDFRKITGRAKVEDCKYKKCDDGYDVPYITSSSVNLLDTSIENGQLSYPGVNYTPVTNGFKISNTSANAYANVTFKVFLKANVSYRIGYTKSDAPSGFVDFKTLSLSWIANLNSGTVFTVSETGYYYIIFYCTAGSAAVGSATFTDIRLVEGRDLVAYTPYIKTNKYFEIIEENDIEDLRHQVSLTGFNYDKILNTSFDKLLRGEL